MAARKDVVAKAIPKGVPEKDLMADLKRFQRKALELGASGAEIIPADSVLIDERVRMKCFIPRCFRMGETPNCPPYTPEPEEARKALSKYSWAILIKTDIAPLEDYMPQRERSSGKQRHTLRFHKKAGEIVGELEGLAFKDGYYLALGLGGGSCKDYLCDGLVCQFLDSGKCRFPLRARPSMEALGIDVFDIVNKMGWSVYPVRYHEEDPDSIPCAISVGIVFIH